MLSYTTLNEKNKNFLNQPDTEYQCQNKIETIEDLNRVINFYKGKTNFIFRGSKEAKYMVLSQLQLQWLNKGCSKDIRLFNSYIKDCISKLKNTNRFNKLIQSNGLKMEHSDFFALAILQHYGIPTPLIDLTEDINVGLFFMTDNLVITNCQQSEIDNYSSLYVINKKHPYIVSYQNLMEEGNYNADKMLDEHFINNPKDKKLILERENPYTYDKVCENGTGLILERGFFKTNSSYFGETTFVINSKRQEQQKGLFALNSQLEKSLEKFYCDWYKSPIMICYNINKKLTGEIKKYLESIKIDKDIIYQREVIGSEMNTKMVEESAVLTLEQYCSSCEI